MNSKAWMIATALLAAGTAQATCYGVYKANGTLIQESSTTPVNLTQALGDTVPMKFGPGAFMVMSDQGVYCKERHEAQAMQEVAVAPVAVKKAAEVKVEAAVEHQPTDEELLALKPEVVEPHAPVRGVEVKVMESAEGTPASDAAKVQHEMGAGKVAERVE